MKHITLLPLVLSIVGCSSVTEALNESFQGVQNAFIKSSQPEVKYDEIVYVKIRRCLTEAEKIEQNKKREKELEGVPLGLRVELGRKEALNELNTGCVDIEEYKKLASDENCRLDYFGDIECAKHVYSIGEAERLRYENRTLFQVEWNYKERTAREIQHITTIGNYDVDKYGAIFEKLKQDKRCKLIDKKTLSCNMKVLKELE